MPRPSFLPPATGRLDEKLQRRYRKAFIRHGLTQNAVARGVGRQGSTIAKWLAGKFTSAVLRRQVDELLERTPIYDRRLGPRA